MTLFYTQLSHIFLANKINKSFQKVRYTKKLYNILIFLRKKGLIETIEKHSDNNLKVNLVSFKGKKILKDFKYSSVPSNFRYYSYKQLLKISRRKKFLFSCDSGLFYSSDLFFIKKGGIIIFELST